jgi:hypothetical protein
MVVSRLALENASSASGVPLLGPTSVAPIVHPFVIRRKDDLDRPAGFALIAQLHPPLMMVAVLHCLYAKHQVPVLDMSAKQLSRQHQRVREKNAKIAAYCSQLPTR